MSSHTPTIFVYHFLLQYSRANSDLHLYSRTIINDASSGNIQVSVLGTSIAREALESAHDRLLQVARQWVPDDAGYHHCG
jgi:hypothetical protein